MLRIRFAPRGPAIGLGPGERLLDALDELGEHPLDFPCRDASCGRCLVSVVDGGRFLRGANPHERDTLARVGASAQQRLACQVTAGEEPGDVTLAQPQAKSAG